MSFDLSGILAVLAVMITIYGWLASMQARERVHRSPSRSSLPRSRRSSRTEFDLPPTDWPEWAVGQAVPPQGDHDDLDEGLSVERSSSIDVLVNAPVVAASMGVEPVDPYEDGDHHNASELLKGVIWSEILQPPLSLRAKRR